MHLISRFGSRKTGISRRPATSKLRPQALEDRALPSFGFGSAVGIGSTGDDRGNAIVLDAAGNMYVSGFFSGTVDFDANGTNPTSNHVLTATSPIEDGFVAKYSANDTFQWATDLSSSYALELAVQGSNVYVPYVSVSGAGGFVSQLNAATGAVTWTTNITPTGDADAVAVSPSGVLYADGFSGGSASQAIVDQLDPATGNILWTRTTSGTGGHANGYRLAVDSAGNAYATGAYGGTENFGGTPLTSYSGTYDAFVWKLNSGGGTVWAGSIGSSGGTDPWGITTDASGNAYMTGDWIAGTNNFNPASGKAVSLTHTASYTDDFIVKFTPGKNGAMSLGWAKDIGGTSNSSLASGNAVAVDGSGNVYTTGYFTGPTNFNPNSGTQHVLQGYGAATGIFVSELDVNGNYVAAAELGGSGGGGGRGIALDGSGNAYATGYFGGTANFSPNGTYDLTSNGGNDIFVSVLTQTSPQLAVVRGPNVGVVPLTQKQLSAVEAAAIDDWAAAGLPAADIAKMKSVTANVKTLSGNWLGAAELNGNEIAIDATADGWGWSVNATGKPAANRMDLLTVVEHELGHTIGLDSRFSGSPSDLMYAYLAPGERRLPGVADVPAGSTSVALLNAAPRPSDEDQVDWLSVAAALKPKSNLYTGWLADGQ